MSKFYGQVRGQADTLASRRGSNASGLRVSAQSWDGSLVTTMRYVDDKLYITLEYADTSSFYGQTIFDGTLEELTAKLR